MGCWKASYKQGVDMVGGLGWVGMEGVHNAHGMLRKGQRMTR